MKLFYSCILIFIEILILYTINKTLAKSIKNSPLANKTRHLLMGAFCTVLPNIFIANVSSISIAGFFYNCYFCSIDFMLFLLVYFSAEYAFPNSVASGSFFHAVYDFFKSDISNLVHKRPKKTSLFERGMILLFTVILLDVANLVSNFWTGRIFKVTRFYFNGILFAPDIYFRTFTDWRYDIHLTLCYLMIAICFLCMLYKIVREPALYKIKYISVIIQIAAVVLINAFYILFESPLDFSVIFYGIISVSLYFFAFKYVHSALQRIALTNVVQNMKNGIIIFDNDDQCIFVNDYIRKIYHIKNNQDPAAILLPVIQRFSNGTPLSKFSMEGKTVHIIEDGRDIFYRVTFSRIESRNKKFIGSYFMLVDTTEENIREKLERFRNTHDPLTGLYNKQHFYDRVAETLEANPSEKYFMLCCDIGNFKLINEFNGESVGDKILKLLAKELSERTVLGEVYGRIDNDRFALLIPKNRLNLQIFIDGADKIFKEAVNLSVSSVCYFGVYEIEDPDMRVSFMCDRAFIAIDSIKGQYGKRVAWYDTKLRNSVLREQELVYQLPEALSSGQIKIFLQPQSTHEGKAVGAEALVRWEHPDEGIVSPAEFIPIFEKNGMITKIDRYVWRQAFQKLFDWKAAGREDFYISVNISQQDFYLMNILNEFTELLNEFNINPINLHIEFTEAVMMMDLERQINLIEQLHKIGFVIEIGDFGAGYSSLKILRECAIDILKIDIDFLFKTRRQRNAHIIIKQLITMAQNLGIKILAKGIETKDQMDLLHDDGSDLFQGFYFSKPIDTKTFEKIYL